MIQMRDWISFFVGAIIFVLGLFPILNKSGIGPEWFSMNFLPVAIFSYIVAGAGFYLMVESVIEITNSNIVGWWSFIIAVVVLLIGLLPLIHSFGRGPEWFAFTWLSPFIYNIIFVIEGFLLMVATFAMEL